MLRHFISYSSLYAESWSNNWLSISSVADHTAVSLLFSLNQCLWRFFWFFSRKLQKFRRWIWFLTLELLSLWINNWSESVWITWKHFLVNKWMQKVSDPRFLETRFDIFWYRILLVVKKGSTYFFRHETDSILKSWSCLSEQSRLSEMTLLIVLTET